MRAAIYFTPDKNNPLISHAAQWLGWDAFRAKPVSCLIKRDERWVVAPSHYGFHATMKAPFHLHESTRLQDIDEALAIFCSKTPAILLPALKITKISNFFALVPEQQTDELLEVASKTVRFFEAFRAALTEQDIKKRNPHLLDEQQYQYLMDYGYPHIFERFRFHMTLTGAIPLTEQDKVEAILNDYFQKFLSAPFSLNGLGIFVEASNQTPFYCHSYYPLVV